MVERRDRDLSDRIAPEYAQAYQVPSSTLSGRYIFLRALGPIFDANRELGVVLDAGCGIARAVDYLEGRFDRYVGVDHSEGMIETARRRVGERSDVELITASIKQLPVPDNIADTILVVGALHHMTDLPSVMASLKRVAKPGASFIALEPHSGNALIQFMRRFRKRLDSTYSADQVAFSGRELRDIAAAGGLVNAQTEYIGFVSPPFQYMRPRPQFIFRPLSKLAVVLDRCVDNLLFGRLRRLSWYIVLHGVFPK